MLKLFVLPMFILPYLLRLRWEPIPFGRCTFIRQDFPGKNPVGEGDMVRRVRQGDAAAWEWVMQQHQEAVFRLAYLILSDPDDAEDVAQEAFIRAYHALGRFDLDRPLRPWLL